MEQPQGEEWRNPSRWKSRILMLMTLRLKVKQFEFSSKGSLLNMSGDPLRMMVPCGSFSVVPCTRCQMARSPCQDSASGCQPAPISLNFWLLLGALIIISGACKNFLSFLSCSALSAVQHDQVSVVCLVFLCISGCLLVCLEGTLLRYLAPTLPSLKQIPMNGKPWSSRNHNCLT